MGKSSSAKKVRRATSTGPSPRGSRLRSLAWPGALAAIVLVGVGLVALSSTGRSTASSEAPRIGDHWHEAYGVYVCGRYLPPFPDNMQRTGIHTHQDGLIHVEPRSTRETGADATVALFAQEVDLEVSQERMVLPDGTTFEDGDDCNGEPGDVRIIRDGEPVDAPPEELRLGDARTVVYAFAPEDAEIPPPPSASRQPDEPAPQPATTAQPDPSGGG